MRLYLKDGSYADILDKYFGFQQLIKEKLGDEAEEYYLEILSDVISDAEEREEDNAEAESWRNYCIDIWHELQEIVYAKRINRKRLLKLTEKMEGDL